MAGFSKKFNKRPNEEPTFIWTTFVRNSKESHEQTKLTEFLFVYVIENFHLLNEKVFNGSVGLPFNFADSQGNEITTICKTTSSFEAPCVFACHRIFTDIDDDNLVLENFGIKRIRNKSELLTRYICEKLLIVPILNTCEYWLCVNGGENKPCTNISDENISNISISPRGSSPLDSSQLDSQPTKRTKRTRTGGKKHTQNKILKRKSYRNRRRTKKAKRSKTRKIYKK